MSSDFFVTYLPDRSACPMPPRLGEATARPAKEKPTPQETQAQADGARARHSAIQGRESASKATALIEGDDGREAFCGHRLDGQRLGCFARTQLQLFDFGFIAAQNNVVCPLLLTLIINAFTMGRLISLLKRCEPEGSAVLSVVAGLDFVPGRSAIGGVTGSPPRCLLADR
jgi:hypothetical protein